MSDPVLRDPETPLVKKTVSAREVSKWGMVLGVLWIGVLSLLKGAWPLIKLDSEFGLSMLDIIYSGLAMVAIFSPVYLSILMDKIKDIKLGGSK